MSNAAARSTVLAAVILTAAFCFASSFIGLNQPSPPTIAATPPRAAAAEDAAPPKDLAPPAALCSFMAMEVRGIVGERDLGINRRAARDNLCMFTGCDDGDQTERDAHRKWTMDLIDRIYRTRKMNGDQEADWYLNTYCGENTTSE
jgi:hypothetical protein